MIFSYTLFHVTLRSSTPILYAGLASTITNSANILNVGIEGSMLMGAFAAVAVSYATGSWFFAVLCAMLVGISSSCVIAVAHLRFGANIFAVGTTINILALAVTKFCLNTLLDSYGSFSSPKIVPLPSLSFDFLSGNPVVDSIFNNYSSFEALGIVLMLLMCFTLYKTAWGLRMRSVGLNADAARSGGINIMAKRWQALLISGALAGLGGAYISLGYTTQFVENMVSGRGFMGIAAMFFGGGHPLFMWIGCLVFGFSDALAARLQSYSNSAQFVLMLPYLVTIIIFAMSMYLQKRRTVKRESAV